MLSSVRPFSKYTGSKGSRASLTSSLKFRREKTIFCPPLSTRASSSRLSTSPRIWWDMVMMLSTNRLRACSSYSGSCKSSALVRITVRGVFSSWEASATNCRCWFHAVSTGFTAHLANRKDSPRNTAKLSTPMITQVFVRLRMVVSSLDISTKTMVCPKGVVRF